MFGGNLTTSSKVLTFSSFRRFSGSESKLKRTYIKVEKQSADIVKLHSNFKL